MSAPLTIGFLLFPGVLQMDFTGPFGVLASGLDADIHLIWKDTRPLLSSDKLTLTPTISMAACPPLDVLCVPGGGGILPLLTDDDTLNFLRCQAVTCRYVTSVCTGALVLGAAGLLRGYKATTHWQSLDLLAPLGAIPVKQRVVIDRNRITAAGVSSGIDMALTLASLLWGDAVAQSIQLSMEYMPEPPFMSGSPETAPPAILESLKSRTQTKQQQRKVAVEKAATALQ